MDTPTILLFAKAPVPGAVKTRLAVDLGHERACAVYRWLGERQYRALAHEFPVIVYHAPVDAGDTQREWLGAGVALRPQSSGDLGARLDAAVRESFADGATSVVLIGTDCPDLGSAEIALAQAHLEQGADAVFGPTSDGGYYLLALRGPQPALFAGIPWSSRATLEVSLAHARVARLRVEILPVKEDVDDLSGLRRAIAAGHVPASLVR